MKIRIFTLIGTLVLGNLFIACENTNHSKQEKTDVANQNLQGNVKKIVSSCYEIQSTFGEIEKSDYTSYMYDHPFKGIDEFINYSVFNMEFSEKGKICSNTQFEESYKEKLEIHGKELFEYKEDRLVKRIVYDSKGSIFVIMNYFYDNETGLVSEIKADYLDTIITYSQNKIKLYLHYGENSNPYNITKTDKGYLIKCVTKTDSIYCYYDKNDNLLIEEKRNFKDG